MSAIDSADVPINDNPYGITLHPVETPSGATINLMALEEQEYYSRRRSQYLEHNHFTNVSDLQDVDRLLTLEVMVYRWSVWLTRGFDYTMARVDEHALKTNIKEYSTEIRLLKQSLGLDKVNREKDKGESVSDYLENLRRRARQFGVHRNNQYEHAVTLMARLRTMVTTFDRCDSEEREELDLSEDAIIEFIRNEVIKPWDEIDAEFRKEQRIWVQEL